MIDMDEQGHLHDRPAPIAGSLPGMALSLTRLVYARLLRRAFEILDLEDEAEALLNYMTVRGILATGVHEEPSSE